MTFRADFTSPDYYRNPLPALARLRSQGPVLWVKFPIVGKVWITTTQEMASRVLKDSETFKLRKDGRPAGLRWWVPGVIRALADNMLTMDEPDHTRLREIVDEAFRRRAIVDMEPRIAAIAEGLADRLFGNGIPADLLEGYARLLPLSVICELLGLPQSDRPKFMAWTSRVAKLTNIFSFARLLVVVVAMKRYLEGQIQSARERGGRG